MRPLASLVALVGLASFCLPALASSLPATPLVAIAGGDFEHPGASNGLVLHVDPFAIERTPVTWRQYKAFAQGGEHWTPLLAEHEGEFPADAPVTYVTFADAQAYAHALGRRLPSEIEWEYVAAAGRTRQRFSYTPEEKAELDWYSGAMRHPRPVGGGSPNAYGVCDMHGNVWEWVADMGGNYSRQDFRDPNSGRDNLGCGNVNNDDGSYAWFLRAAVRAAARPEQPMRFRGFRCAL